MSRKKELIDLFFAKCEAWDFWNDLIGSVKIAAGRTKQLEKDMAELRLEFIKIRLEGEPMEKIEIKEFGLYATITREEYCSESKEETISLMRKEIMDNLGYEGLHDWRVVEHPDTVVLGNDGTTLRGVVSPHFIIGTIIPGEATPVMQLGLKVKKEKAII